MIDTLARAMPTIPGWLIFGALIALVFAFVTVFIYVLMRAAVAGDMQPQRNAEQMVQPERRAS